MTAVRGEHARPEPAAAPEELLSALIGRTVPPPANLTALVRAACAPTGSAPPSDAAIWAAARAWIDPLLAALDGPWSADGFRRRAAATACAARRFAACGHGPEEEATAFATGLLLKIGQLALYYCFPKAYARAIGRAAAHRDGILGAEREVLGIDHALAGKRLADAWSLPAVVRDAAWLLHQPEAAAPFPIHPVLCAARRADQLVRRAAIGWPDYLPVVAEPNECSAAEAFPPDALHAAMDDLLARAAALPVLDEIEPTARPERWAERRMPVGWRDALLTFLTEPTGRSVPEVCAAIARSAQRMLGAPVVVAFAVENNQRTWPAVVVRTDVLYVRMAVSGALAASVGAPDGLSPGAAVDRAPDALLDANADVAGAFGTGCTGLLLLRLRYDRRTVGGLLFAEGSATIAPVDLDLVAAAHAHVLAAALDGAAQRHLAEALVLRRMPEGGTEPVSGFPPMAAMAAGAAHELNTPLAVIAGRAQMLRRDATDARVQQELSVISEHAQRASAIVSELLSCAKPLPPQPEDFSLNAWLERVRQHWEASSTAPPTQFDVRISDAGLQVRADPLQVAEGMHAIIANAIEASAPGAAHVSINSLSRPTDDTIVVSIGDHGRGMPPEILARACDPFFSHRPAGRGRGLGLSRATRLIEINGGRLWIDSTPGQGTTVHVALPAGAPLASAC